MAAQPATGTVTAFTFKAAVYFYNGTPQGELGTLSTVARRSDGTTVEIVSQGPSRIQKNINTRTIRYIDGSTVRLLDAAKAKSTLPPHGAKMWQRIVFHPPSNCLYPAETLIREDAGKVLGQAVVEIRPPAPDGYRITSWVAPGLGCEVLTYHTEKKQPDGTYTLASEQKPLSLQIGEPASALFAPGNGYAEVAPSEFGRRLRALLGSSAPLRVSPSMARADNDYHTLWAQYPDWQGH